ncbi:hypothetical protein [Natronobacterium texcoconense]|uniref:Uncharacterized protein n=1 Tax=Natronobacterium texcoconense TaxID=1095778 RepID=A0A1H1FRI0_NATTX|nr:hypothetical protein [Natronobacterium texcoconense]SDR03683.1 hypothetical protein SAMN04489842_2089 [Natronobacterium texcoconense]
MQQCPRRTLLGGIGTTITVALAGTSVSATSTDGRVETPSESDFESLFEYLPASLAGEPMQLAATDVDSRLEADEPHSHPVPIPAGHRFDVEAEDVSKTVRVTSHDDGYTQPLVVLTGDVDLEGESESRDAHGVEYDYYERDDLAVAVTDDVALFADEAETLETAFAASTGETEQLLEAESTLSAAFEDRGGADSYSVHLVGDEFHLPAADAEDVEYVVHAETVLDPDTIETQYGLAFVDESAITDELVETLEGEFAYMGTNGDPTATVDGSVVTVTAERDLVAERAIREHDSPGRLRVDREFDLEDDELEIEIGRGDPTPIEDLSLELDDEEYDADIWADGHGKLEEGDTIVIDMDDVEPNLSIRLRHDHELGSSSSGTSILSHFRFEFDYDLESESLSITYADDFPLDGDEVHLAAYEERPRYRPDEDDPEPRTSVQPWEGETLDEGAEATLEDVRPGDEIIVGWKDVSPRDNIGRHRIRPPGTVRFDYDYASETLSATLELEDEEQPAEKYELLVDDEPAATQWASETDTVSSEATIEVADVAVGTDVTVVWGDSDARVGGTRPSPSIELTYDDGTVEHVGGDEPPAAKLEVQAWGEDGHEEMGLDEVIDGNFTEGDSFEIDLEDVHNVSLRYDGHHGVGFARPDQ